MNRLRDFKKGLNDKKELKVGKIGKIVSSAMDVVLCSFQRIDLRVMCH